MESVFLLIRGTIVLRSDDAFLGLFNNFLHFFATLQRSPDSFHVGLVLKKMVLGYVSVNLSVFPCVSDYSANIS